MTFADGVFYLSLCVSSLPFSPNSFCLERHLNVLAIEMLKIWNKIRTGNTPQKCKFNFFLRNSITPQRSDTGMAEAESFIENGVSKNIF